MTEKLSPKIDSKIQPNFEKIAFDQEGERRTFDLESHDPNPESIIIKKQRILILRNIVSQLKPKYRNLVRLRYFKEMSYEEIAETLNIPIGTVKAQLYRSREQLFKIISGKRNSF